MRRTDVVASVAVAILLVAFVLLGPTGTTAPILEFGLRYWFVGVALATGSILLRRQKALPRAARVLGIVGVIWVAFVIGLAGVLVLILVARGPIGP